MKTCKTMQPPAYIKKYGRKYYYSYSTGRTGAEDTQQYERGDCVLSTVELQGDGEYHTVDGCKELNLPDHQCAQFISEKIRLSYGVMTIYNILMRRPLSYMIYHVYQQRRAV